MRDKIKWLKKIVCKNNEECSDCGEKIKKGDICYINKSNYLWCIECKKLEELNN